MNHIQKLAFALFFPVLLIPVLAQTTAATHSSRKVTHDAAAPAASTDISRGQKVFQQNCSRCHNAPQSFPPQISGTILRHMRVRASLSAADERVLLEFLNP